MVSNLDLQLRQQSSLAFMLGQDLQQCESQHADGIAVLKAGELLLQDLTDAVEMGRCRSPGRVHHLTQLLVQLVAFLLVP